MAVEDAALTQPERWALVNGRLREEAKAATDETKLRQLASLMGSVDDFGWHAALAEDDVRVRTLWSKLQAKWNYESSPIIAVR